MADLTPLIQAIHDAPPRLVYVFAGAGSLALYWLHAAPGSSRTLLEARDCYAPRSLAAILGAPPAQAVSVETAGAMAGWAWQHAASLAEDGWPLLGVGCTAAIATDRARRGADRAIVAVRSASETRIYELFLDKERRDRAAEEELISRLVILAIAEGCGVGQVSLALGPEEALRVRHYPG
ncbi:MAG: hypothetical protein RMK84_13130 [Oscillochloridaceae bacterium]|nr:hypothetical protein [Chloroflexaceae bacterium]MDW8391063.1 hypothetical protein [Oscillochloridaceae bacterium]